MPEQYADSESPASKPRVLAYLVATLLVTFVLKAKFPEQLCRFADGFHARIAQVDPLFFAKQWKERYDGLTRVRLAKQAESGGTGAMHGTAFGDALSAGVHAVKMTIAADAWTMVLTLGSLVLGLILMARFGFWPGPLTPLLLIALGTAIAWLLSIATAFLSGQLGCNGTLFVVGSAVAPVVMTALSIRDTAQMVQRALERRRRGR